MKIKICGLKEPENISDIASLQPDMMGFIFYPKSKRYVGDNFDSTILSTIPKTICKVGVFVNESIENVLNTANRFQLDAIQLHGDESKEYCSIIRSNGYDIIKAISVQDSLDLNILHSYVSSVDYFLFDTGTKDYGGSGQQFNWEILKDYDLETPFILSGGLGTENISAILSFHHPKCIGVDANSRLEDSPGIKNIELTQSFINSIKNATI